jgi:chloramphenicol 3-O phosphotransferase
LPEIGSMVAKSQQAGRVVVLNGIGSVGKSSIARALQQIASEPMLHVRMDAFLEMLPEAMQDHPDAYSYETIHQNGTPLVIIKGGPVGERLMRGMIQAIAAMAAVGNSLIVDEVMDGSKWQSYAATLAKFRVHLVGLFAPLEVLEARERARGDRMIGLARWQYGRVHKGMKYDLEIDTAAATPEECAMRIKDAFGL